MFSKLGCRRPMLGGLLLAAVLLASGPASAQEKQKSAPAPIPSAVIAVIDVQGILRDASAAKDIRVQRDKYAQTYQAEVSKEENALREADQELARQRALLSPEAFVEKRRALEQRLADFQRTVQAKRRALDEAYGAAMDVLYRELISISTEVAQQRGANLVIAKSQIFLHDPAMEVTAAAIERLNRKLPKVKFPEPKVTPLASGGSSDASAAPTSKKN